MLDETIDVRDTDRTRRRDHVFEDEPSEVTVLQLHDSAPVWVRNWGGPYSVTIDAE